jgi:xanthine/uracil permease
VVTGAVVMLIGFNLATVATTIYFPNDQWVALRGIADQFSAVQSCSAAGKCVAVHRIDWSAVAHAPWIGLPKTVVSPTFGTLTGPHMPAFKLTGDDLDRYLGRAFIGDGIGTALASAVGGSPTTTYAENIGVMAATRIYSTLAYYIAAVVAILFGFCPKFGAVVAATPGGVLGGITLGAVRDDWPAGGQDLDREPG